MRYAILPVIALFATALAGCEKTIACTDLYAYGVSIEVQDDTGALIDDAIVQYNADGGAFEDCENLGNGSYACAGEQDGAITVRVEWNGATETMDFDIESDECHVIGQSATIVMTP